MKRRWSSSRSARIMTVRSSPAANRRSIPIFCGKPHMRRRVAQLFVAVGDKPSRIAGYYSLSAASFGKDGLPPTLSKRLPHYPVPAAVLGRLAVDRAHQGRGLGEALLLDAIRRTLRASMAMAVYAVIVDVKNDNAQAFYERYGFRAFAGQPRRLFLPLETFEKLRL
jgi:GNAT superfamily N-acetyltransferase